MTHDTAKAQGLDPVFTESHELGLRYFYDAAAGQYYDAATDLYVSSDRVFG